MKCLVVLIDMGVSVMEEPYKELEEMRSELETLKVDYREKFQLSESLRRALDEQLFKFQNVRVENEKQAKEIDAKSEEIALAKQMYEDLEFKFREKDSALRELISANESSRSGLKEKIIEFEQANKQLVFALDEANVKVEEQGKVVCTYKKEIEGLNVLLSQSQQKYFDAEHRAKASKDVRRRDEMLDEFVREKGEIEDRLKWKSEQFRYLEDAFHKIQDELLASKKEWASEKTNLINDMSSLQSSLDIQIQVAEGLHSQLQMCNQALAHEESRRRLLEIQMSESKAIHESMVLEYEEAKSNIQTLTARRDEEIASLRNSMSDKMMLIKDLEYKSSYLDQQNQDLLESLKLAQEAQIVGADASASLKSLRQKFIALELVHKGCSQKLKAMEFDLSQQMKKFSQEINEYLLKLNSKDEEITVLEEEVECSHYFVAQGRMEHEEISVILMLLQSKFMENTCDLTGQKYEVEQQNLRAEEKISFLTKQLENKNVALTKAVAEVVEEREKLDLLHRRIEQLETVNGEYSMMQKELASCKELLSEVSGSFEHIKEQAALKEINLQENLRKALSALDQANASVSEKIHILNEVRLELQQQRNVVSQLEEIKCELETELQRYRCEHQESTRRMEDAILEKMKVEKILVEVKENSIQVLEEKERRFLDLEQQRINLEKHLARRELDICAIVEMELQQSVMKEKDDFLKFAENINRRLTSIESAFDLLEKNHGIRGTEILTNLEQLRARYADFMEEKLSEISNMQQCIMSYHQDYFRLVEAAASSRLLDKLVETSEHCEECDKLKVVQILDKQELQYKKLLIAELDEDIVSLQVKLDTEEKLSSKLVCSIQQLQAKSDKEKFQLVNELKKTRYNLDEVMEEKIEAEAKKKVLHEVMEKFSLQKDALIEQLMGVYDLIGKISNRGKDVSKNWDGVLQKTICGIDAVSDMECNDLISCKMTHGRKCTSSLTLSDREGDIDQRLPLKEQNLNF